MKERITMQRLMQEGWIPVLTGILSASVIVSLAHSTGMAYVTALLLMALYFVAIAANRVNAKAIAAIIGKRILQQVVQKLLGMLSGITPNKLCGIVPLLGPMMQVDLTKHCPELSSTALTHRFPGLGGGIESMLSVVNGSASVADSGGLIVRLKNRKMALGRLIQTFKTTV